MTEEYFSVADAQCEITICRSHFIGRVFNIKNEEEAIQILKQLKKEYSDATHICYGYVADIAGNTARFSDGGEPAGTAGLPIIEAIKKRNLRLVLVAVIRYFGGIKLGAGGLTRAYGDCALGAINSAKSLVFSLCNIYGFSVDFSLYPKITKGLSGCKIINAEFAEAVNIKLAAPCNIDFERLLKNLTDGRVEPIKLGEEYIEIE